MSPQPLEALADGETARFAAHPGERSECVDCASDMLSSFNHSCRNSLNGIKLSLYLFKHGIKGQAPQSLGELERSCQQIEVFFDRLQLLYRRLSLTMVRAPLGRFLDDHVGAWQCRFSTRGRTLDFSPPVDDLAGDFDPMFMGLGLDGFVAWRAEAAQPGSRAVVTWTVVDGSLVFRWTERPPEIDWRMQGCGNGLDRTLDGNGEADSLALLLLKRIVRAHGGSVQTSNDSTLLTTARWPRFHVNEPPGVPRPADEQMRAIRIYGT